MRPCSKKPSPESKGMATHDLLSARDGALPSATLLLQQLQILFVGCFFLVPRGDLLRRCCFPNLHGLVGARRGNTSAVRRKRHRINQTGVPFEREQFPAALFTGQFSSYLP